ncbi:MAG: glycosyltransferase family protein [Candidatus Sumerlaeia bacterium]|nr:glycosyltransferase family protein [Candidatus Sumerlaeia bacterium]
MSGRTIAIIQARAGSTRLPRKVLMPLEGVPMLAHLVARVRAVPALAAVVVATSTLDRDDDVAAVAREAGAEVFRGSEGDVLSRYHEAAREFQATTVVRITGDCPLYDGGLLAEMLARRAALSPHSYYSNAFRRTYPRGLDTEIFERETLELVHRLADDPAEREHVTAFLWRRPTVFECVNHENPEGDWSHWRWTVDTPEDFAMVTRVYAELYPRAPLFDRHAVAELLRARPEIAAINSEVAQKPV